MGPSNESKLKASLVAAIGENRQMPDREIAALVVKAEPALIADWAIDRLAAWIRVLRPKPPGSSQLAFPFHDLSIMIPLKDGRRAELGPATIGILRQSERVLIEKHRNAKPRSNSLLGRIQREIALMEPWAYSNHRITVERVQQLIATGTEPPPVPVKRSPVSDAMKRYWDGKTPEERSAIIRGRFGKTRWKKKTGVAKRTQKWDDD